MQAHVDYLRRHNLPINQQKHSSIEKQLLIMAMLNNVWVDYRRSYTGNTINIIMISGRSAHETLAAGQLARTAAHHTRDLSIFLSVRRTALHEEPQTLWAEEYADRVQFHSGGAERGSGRWGTYRSLSCIRSCTEMDNIIIVILNRAWRADGGNITISVANRSITVRIRLRFGWV